MKDTISAADQQKNFSSEPVEVYVVQTAGIAVDCFTSSQVELKRYCVCFGYI